ncbi:hypothetical protein ACFQY5_30780 [Paeniroseomonas aquatica]|uniref:hypothetical protein n=1 Tax=Paeniroseomonas aquatica TaxID=373043 RepID=UPI003618A57D
MNGLDDGALLAPTAPRRARARRRRRCWRAMPPGWRRRAASCWTRRMWRCAPSPRRSRPPGPFCAGIDALPPCSAPWAGRWPTCMPAAAAVRAALAGLPADWLRDAARRMAALVTADREGFRRG